MEFPSVRRATISLRAVCALTVFLLRERSAASWMYCQVTMPFNTMGSVFPRLNIRADLIITVHPE